MQSEPGSYVYTQWIDEIGQYWLLILDVVYAWLNVALSFVTRPLSSLLAVWMRVIIAFAMTVMLIVSPLLPVFFKILS